MKNTNAEKQNKSQRKQERLQKRQARLERQNNYVDEQEILNNKLTAIAKLQKADKRWFKLDNAALVYPMSARGESTSVFRLAVQLREPVDPVTLQYAVNDVCVRFPTICGCVKSGFFWPFIDKPSFPIVVKKQTKVPGRPMHVDARRSQIRVNYYHNQIAVEFFHSATDGNGGLVFLNSLLRCYFEKLGTKCDLTNSLDWRDIPTLEEVRDNFANVAVKRNPPPTPPVIKARKINGKVMPNGKYVTIRGICSAQQLVQVAHSHNATVTEFLGAVQLLALNKLAKVTNSNDKHPIRILIPVNLRKVYDVETIRNFASYVFYQYNGQTNIDEVIADIKQQYKQQFTDDYFRGMVSFNYNNGNNPLLKVVPLLIKKAVIGAVANNRGDGSVDSSIFSNLGVVKAPAQFADKVIRYEFMLGKPPKTINNFSAITYNDVCVITMTSKFWEKDCEKFYFAMLAQLGVDIAMESDIWEEEV